jgi:DNA-binding transcriptional MocR family regulator
MAWVPELGARKGPLYLALADAIAEDVAAGRLPPGFRMPTHRDLAELLDVTVGTVSRGYAAAARRGLLSGEIGRGTFVRGTAEEESPAILDLAHNHPPLGPLGPEAVNLRETLRQLAEGDDLHMTLGYAPEGGYSAHREAGASWIRLCGLPATVEETLVCGGSQHGLATVLSTLLAPGDHVVAEEVTYPGMKAVAGLLRLRLEGLACDEEGLLPAAFEAACREGAKALYCAPTIQNPTASVMPASRRERIAAIARRHSVWIVEDDVHALLPSERLPPISSFAPELSFYLVSTSKTLAPGLRIAFLRTPAPHAGRLKATIRATIWGAPLLMGEIVARWIRGGEAEAIIRSRRSEARARQALAARSLSGARTAAHPEGYHVWLHLPDPWRSDTFTQEAQRHGVLVTPAAAFAIGRVVPHAVRVCLGAARSHDQLEAGLALVQQVLRGVPEADTVV